jgi:hypothetical protein
MICYCANPVCGQAVAMSSAIRTMSLNAQAEITPGRFRCWLQKTSCEHNAVIEQASALMRTHRRTNKVDSQPNRQVD